MFKKTLNIAFVGNYLPRICGIATFTTDLCESTARILSPKSHIFAIAINDTEKGYNYPERVIFAIEQSQQKDYFEAANIINTSNAEIACIQHEYGIYGGIDGIYVLSLLSKLNVPTVVTLHTVLRNPSPNQKKIIQEIASHSSKLIVMSELAVEFLKNIYGVEEEKIEMIHHGTPNFHTIDSTPYKKRFKLEGRETLLTFGLISPSKGIETVIRALPKVVKKFPNLIYVVLGQTHPHIKKEYGEKYRTGLIALVEKLKLENNVVFDNRFVSIEELYAWLLAVDIYITPYTNEDQIVSGTLAYAIGAGKAIISTPYHYAKELLADGRGIIINFNDSETLSEVLIELLSNKNRIKELQKKAIALGKKMHWSKVAEKYVEVFQKAARGGKKIIHVATSILPMRMPGFDISHLVRLTDDTGLIQHAKYIIPDRETGYCLDDNARALLLTSWAVYLLKNEEAKRLLSTYLSFTYYMQRPDGKFRNFLDYQRKFTEEEGSDDSSGRAIWALGYLIWRPPSSSYRAVALDCFKKALPHIKNLNLRGKAFSILGLSCYLRCYQYDENARMLLKECADKLVEMYKNTSEENWRWFENILCYDNGILPMSLFNAYSILHEEIYKNIAEESLEFLEKNTFLEGHLSLIGNNGWYKKGGERAKFDQQPIDACGMVLAYQSAYRITKKERYLKRMKESFYWFLGENDLGVPLYDYETKGCADGLMEKGVNLNQGAESTVSFLLALLAMIEEYEIQHKTFV